MSKPSNKLAFALMLLMAAGLASAAPASSYTAVNGFVLDPSKTGIAGASVNVLCTANSNSFSTTSLSNGYYSGGFDCPINATVSVNATKSGASATALGTSEYITTLNFGEVYLDLGLAFVNVEIPEFPTAAVPALLSMLSFGLVRYRRK